jgi:peptidoglycan LD-endopeptidase CwlK
MTKGHHEHKHRFSHFIHHILHPHDTGAAPTTHTVNETQLRGEGFNSSTINLLKRVDGRLERLVEETGKVLRQEGLNIKMQVTQGLRTAREQLACYQDGKSKCDGYKRKSNHQSGRAIDYSLYNGKGRYLTGDDAASATQYRKVADAFKIAAHRLGYDIQWGGDWKKFKDNDHIEVARIKPNRRGPAVT